MLPPSTTRTTTSPSCPQVAAASAASRPVSWPGRSIYTLGRSAGSRRGRRTMSAVRPTLDARADSSGGTERRRSRDECSATERRSSLVAAVRSQLRRGSKDEAGPQGKLEERRESRSESRTVSRAESRSGSRAESESGTRSELRDASRRRATAELVSEAREESRAGSQCVSRRESPSVTRSGNLIQPQPSANSKSRPETHSEARRQIPPTSPTVSEQQPESPTGSRSDTRPEIRISCVAASSEPRLAVRKRKVGVYRRRGRVDTMASRPSPLDLTRTAGATSTAGAGATAGAAAGAETALAALSADPDADIAFFQQRLGGTTPRVVGATLKKPESASAGPRSPGVRSPPWAQTRASVFDFGDEARGGLPSPSPGPSPGPDTVSASFFFESDDDPPAALRSERDFIEYVLSLPSADHGPERLRPPGGGRKSASAVGSSKVGLEHLDHLCKLMEQLGDLKEQNSVLQRRIQYLEELKGLQEAQWSMSVEPASPSVTSRHRHGSEESLLKIRTGDAPATKGKRNLKLKRALYLQQRERSKSVGHDVPEVTPRGGEVTPDTPPPPPAPPRPARTTVAALPPALPPRRNNELTAGKAKISKWTKVKEAFRWEKAQEIREDAVPTGEPGVRVQLPESAISSPLPESKSQDSGLEVDRSRLLQIPGSRSRDSHMSPSPVDSMLSGEWMSPAVCEV